MNGTGLTIGVVRARRNDQIVDRLAEGVSRRLADLKVTKTVEVSVPGCSEIPLAAKYLADSGEIDAIVCIGAVIEGQSTRSEMVSQDCGRGVQQVQLSTGVPVLLGLLAVEDQDQALAQSEGPGGRNAGRMRPPQVR
ncbi:UNVERIFIED_CONTAM: hypothetical protein GTU68_038569 [Idotea baltica]|nr:hypothetical protein [Idotea baltica]